MAKSVKVHDDTHRALKELKAERRKGSIDQVVRELILASTGTKVEDRKARSARGDLTPYLKD